MPAKRIGRPATGATKTKKSVTIDTDILDAAENAASSTKTSLSALVEKALEKYLESIPMALSSTTDSVDLDESENIIAFPEIPLLHAAAGEPFSADGDTYAPTREFGPGRFACQLHGDSMATKYPDGKIVILRERDSLKKPVLKKGEIYLFVIAGEKTLKVWDSRVATADEIDQGITYVSTDDGKTKVHILRPLNKSHAEIVITGEAKWIGWLDKDDNKSTR